MRRALLHESRAALVDEDGVRLLRRAAHVSAMGCRAAVAVRGDRRAGVGDVASVRVRGRIARSQAESPAHEYGGKSEQREPGHRLGQTSVLLPWPAGRSSVSRTARAGPSSRSNRDEPPSSSPRQAASPIAAMFYVVVQAAGGLKAVLGGG